MDRTFLPDASPRLSIGELSKRTGSNPETVRYYERIGLLPAPARSEGGHRMYGLGHLKRLGFVRHARELGFSVEAVRELLKLAERDQPCDDARGIASTHLVEVQEKIAALRTMERVLQSMVARCQTEHAPECPLIEALFEEHRAGTASALGGD